MGFRGSWATQQGKYKAVKQPPPSISQKECSWDLSKSTQLYFSQQLHHKLVYLRDIYWSALCQHFLSLSTIDILGWIILCAGDCPVHCSVLSGILGLYPLNISTIHPCPRSNEQKMFPSVTKRPLGDKITPIWEPLFYAKTDAWALMNTRLT